MDKQHFDQLVKGVRGAKTSELPTPDVRTIREAANISRIDTPTEVLPGVFQFRTVSEEKGTMELNEISMASKTPKGL